MNAGLLKRQEWTFQVYAQYSAICTALLHGGKRCLHRLPCIADQRREDAGRSKFPVRGGYLRQCGSRRIGIEEDISAAIDLEVDECRCQPRVIWQTVHLRVRRTRVSLSNPSNVLAVDHHSGITMNGLAVEDRTCGYRMVMAPSHVVRVILERFRGIPGSKPRRSANFNNIA